jgi:hypothetical protein
MGDWVGVGDSVGVIELLVEEVEEEVLESVWVGSGGVEVVLSLEGEATGEAVGERVRGMCGVRGRIHRSAPTTWD